MEMKSNAQDKKRLEDLIDESTKLMNKTIEEAVDDANAVWLMVFGEYRQGDVYDGVPVWKQDFMSAAVETAFFDPFNVGVMELVSSTYWDELSDTERKMLFLIEHHFSMWAKASLMTRAQFYHVSHEITGFVEMHGGDLKEWLKPLTDARDAVEAHIGRLYQLTFD